MIRTMPKLRSFATLAMLSAGLGGCSCASGMRLDAAEVAHTRLEVEPRDLINLERAADGVQVAWFGRLQRWGDRDAGIAVFEYLKAPPAVRTPNTSGPRVGVGPVDAWDLVPTGDTFRAPVEFRRSIYTAAEWPAIGDVVLVVGSASVGAVDGEVKLTPIRGILHAVRTRRLAGLPQWVLSGLDEGAVVARRSGTHLVELFARDDDHSVSALIQVVAEVRQVVGEDRVTVAISDLASDRTRRDWRSFPRPGVAVTLNDGRERRIGFDASNPQQTVSMLVALLRAGE